MAFLVPSNVTPVAEFILLGFSDIPEMQNFLFATFLSFYLVTLVANSLLLITVSVDRSLHTPMYFFLGNLSFLEIVYTSNIVPRMLVGLISDDKSISFISCMVQFYFFGSLGGTECLLLSVMSFDHYIAICNPLHYANIMNDKMCFLLATGSWISGFLITLITLLLMTHLSFCGPNEINHFFCDFSPLLKLVCSDAYLFEKTSFILSSSLTLIPFIFTIISYAYILSAVLKQSSGIGSKRAISTCSSHLIVVTTFYGTLITMYVVPSAKHSIDTSKIFSIFYTIVTPMINPLIYSLRNREVREALRRLINTKHVF
ncbi:olfactory receptor 10A7-like [Anolis sagrei]|uniref:olfactory receptor 10A7-like n=1 Tax=Anolis sagrei TaxID=38937 RepID=UPI003521A6AD